MKFIHFVGFGFKRASLVPTKVKFYLYTFGEIIGDQI